MSLSTSVKLSKPANTDNLMRENSPPSSHGITIAEDGSYLAIAANGQTSRFHAIWLRDNARDNETRSAANGQRLITLADIPADTRIDSVSRNDNTLSVRFQPEDKTTVFEIDWLLQHAYDLNPEREAGWINNDIELWDTGLSGNVPTADFDAVSDANDVLLQWLTLVSRYGFGKLTGGPIEEQAVLKVVDLFGHVRETNYGRFFDVRAEVNPSNLAYTGLGLQAHTDNPYRDPVPTIQVLYCLESSAAGGDNMVVDGFAAVKALQRENPDWFEVLSSHCARFEYAGSETVHLRARRPMIELAPDGELTGVRFNNRSAAAITDVSFDQMAFYYEAYRLLGAIIDDPSMEVTFRLSPGECFIVDNTRVLHARKGFSGNGSRWLQGCYADKDALQSTISVLAANSAAQSEKHYAKQ